jgi:iron complex outermembrane receptor protein
MIKQLPVQSLDDLLDVVSGVDVRQRGVGGTQSDISVRGGSFDQVLVLLNGVNITDPQTGHYNMDIPVELSDVSRIELLQGSAARLYGPNAFSGAINIVTEKLANNAISAQLTAGSYNTYTQNVSGNIGNKKLSSFNSVSNKTSDGYIPNTDYRILSAFSHTTLTTNKAGKFDLQLAYQQKSYGANAFYSFKYPRQFDHTKTLFAALNWQYSKQNFGLTAQTYYRKHYDRYELYRDSISTKPAWYTGHNYHLSDVLGGKATATIQSDFVKSTFGVDVRNEHIFSNTLGNVMASPVNNLFDDRADFTKEDNRLLATGFADFSKTINKFNLSVGGSATYTKQYAVLWFGGADLTYNLNEAMRLYLSYNNAVNLPTYTDLYLQTSINKGNVNLLPSQSSTLEIGIKYNKQQLKVSAAAYYRMGKNAIDWVLYPSSTKWESINHPKLNAFGLDVMAQYNFKNSFLRAATVAYSYISLDKIALNFDSKYALDYLRHKVVFTLSHSIYSKLSAQWKVSYNDRAGDYTDFATNNKMAYTPFVMTDLRLLWSEKHVDIFADGNNLLNVNYADYGGLIQPGINFNAGVRVRL